MLLELNLETFFFSKGDIMKPFFPAPKPSMELTNEPEFKFKFTFIVNYNGILFVIPRWWVFGFLRPIIFIQLTGRYLMS